MCNVRVVFILARIVAQQLCTGQNTEIRQQTRVTQQACYTDRLLSFKSAHPGEDFSSTVDGLRYDGPRHSAFLHGVRIIKASTKHP
jgi:hypothetical protein